MSLDVSLYSQEKKTVACYACGHEHEEQEELYTRNITHNLGKMASEAGLYQLLWCATDNNLTTAKQLIKGLEKGLAKLRTNPEKFKKFNPENGWGNYENLIDFTEHYLVACKKYPEAEVRVSK